MEEKVGRTSLSLYQSFRRSEGEEVTAMKHSNRKRSNQIARELSDMVTYVQVSSVILYANSRIDRENLVLKQNRVLQFPFLLDLGQCNPTPQFNYNKLTTTHP